MGTKTNRDGWIDRRAVLRSASLALPAVLAPSVVRARPGGAFTVAALSPVPVPEAALEATRASFERALSRPVAVRHYRSGARLVDAVVSDRARCAVHTSLTFAASSLVCSCAEPVLRPVARDGTAGQRAVLIVRRDGPVRALADLAGREVLGAETGSVTGEVLRGALAVEARYDGRSMAAAPARFTEGEGDALAGYERIDRDGTAIGGTLERLAGGEERYAVLWRSFPLWHGPITVASDLTASLRDRLVAEMVSLRPGGPAMTGLGLGNVRTLVAASAEEYAPLLALLQASQKPIEAR